MKSLGKIAFVLLLLQTLVYASAVEAVMEQNPIEKGDEAVLIITAKGQDVVFPKIEAVAGEKITSDAITRSLISINGKVNKTLTKRYTFHPQKSLHIPSYKVSIDGTVFETKPLELQVKKEDANGTKSFLFEAQVDKQEVYVGEPIVLTYTFKQRLNVDLTEANFAPPSFSHFWAKTTEKIPNSREGEYNVYRVKYLLFPQSSGDIEVPSAKMEVGIVRTRKRNFFSFQQAKWKTIFSNSLTLKVKELPVGVSIYGDYTMDVVVDKNTTKANEPVNLTITIRGAGNVDDIDDFKIEVPHATVYADKATRNSNLMDDKNEVIFKQQFAIVSESNFTIPSLDFTFFNGEVKALHSASFDIEVENAKVLVAQKATLQKAEHPSSDAVSPTVQVVTKRSDTATLIMIALGSFVLGALSMWLANHGYRREKVSKVESIEKQILRTKEDKALLSLLLPYVDKSPKMQRLIKELEENVYAGKSHPIDRKGLAKTFSSYLQVAKEEVILKD